MPWSLYYFVYIYGWVFNRRSSLQSGKEGSYSSSKGYQKTLQLYIPDLWQESHRESLSAHLLLTCIYFKYNVLRRKLMRKGWRLNGEGLVWGGLQPNFFFSLADRSEIGLQPSWFSIEGFSCARLFSFRQAHKVHFNCVPSPRELVFSLSFNIRCLNCTTVRRE